MRPPEEDWRFEEEFDDEELSVPELELEPEPVLPLVLDVVPLLLDVAWASDCMVPTRANTPAVAASTTVAARAAVRRVPRRTAATAPLSRS
ncbi:hypothetical protein [Streptomyces sp. NPDC086519]|uniref:hypothetical protein n=1 Tax=Streptomyces sp. NPDC086519 TaxID=3154863 RepID=UPI003421CF87